MIKTKRLTLHAFSDVDQAAMITLLTNETIKQTFMIPDFTQEEEVIALFQKIKEDSLHSDSFQVGIYKGEKLIGFINNPERDGDTMELGYVIHPAYHKQGYATEALKAVIPYLFQQGCHEIRAGAFEDNYASIKVMEACGMKRIGKEDDIFYHEKMHHCIYYAIQDTESK